MEESFSYIITALHWLPFERKVLFICFYTKLQQWLLPLSSADENMQCVLDMQPLQTIKLWDPMEAPFLAVALLGKFLRHFL